MTSDRLIRQASAKMAHYLVVRLTRGEYDPAIIVQAGEAVAGWSLSLSEHAEYLLCHDLDLTLPKTGHEKSVAKSTSLFSAHFASGRYDEHFSKILENYLAFVDWQGEVPTTRRFFQAPDKHIEILGLLADLGYLTVSKHEFCWTDKGGQEMLRAVCWTPEFESYDDIRDA